MGLTRLCPACDKVIRRAVFIELQMRVLETAGDPNQDEKDQAYDSYCDECIASGAAVKNLLSGLSYELEVKS